MRILIVAGAATLLMLSATAPAFTCSDSARHMAQAVSTDLSAAKKKPMKAKKEKVEYMKASG